MEENNQTEDILDNPFYNYLITKYAKLYARIEEMRYSLCIPPAKSLHSAKFSENYVCYHVLIPSPFLQDQFSPLADKNKVINISNGHFVFGSKKVKILHEETFYNKKFEPFRVFCIEKEFCKSGTPSRTPSPTPKFASLYELSDGAEIPSKRGYFESTEYLSSFEENILVLKKIDSVVNGFAESYVFVKGYEQNAANRIKTIIQQAIEYLACCNLQLRSIFYSDREDLVTQLVESYVMGSLHGKIFNHICSVNQKDDQKVSTLLERAASVSPLNLGIKKDFVMTSFSESVGELSQLDDQICPIDKLYCIHKTYSSIASSIESKMAINADDILPIFVYVVILAKPTNLISNLFYIQQFSFSNILDNSPLAYSLTSFQVAIGYIQSKEFLNLPDLLPESEIIARKQKVRDPPIFNSHYFAYQNPVASALSLDK